MAVLPSAGETGRAVLLRRARRAARLGKTNRSGIRFCFGEARLLDECNGAGELRVE
ncbi:MAG: hypothetical protein WBP81_00235 [Solirubrobacteraceae bacterium]